MKKIVMVIVFVHTMILMFGNSVFAQTVQNGIVLTGITKSVLLKIDATKDEFCKLSSDNGMATIQKMEDMSEDIRELCLLLNLTQVYNDFYANASSMPYDEQQKKSVQLSKGIDNLFHSVTNCSVGKLITEFTKQIIKDGLLEVNSTTKECMADVEKKCP